MTSKPITTFLATLPSTASALSMDGQGETRVRLEISKKDLPSVLKLSLLTDKVFRVEIYEEQEEKREQKEDEIGLP